MQIKLTPRLDAAAEMAALPENSAAKAADVGTDHALLPIALLERGFSRVRASDIAEGPCEHARATVERYNLADRIDVVRAAGLDGIDAFAPDLICICGMGGELTASILAASDYPRRSRCQLILQPQTMQDVLREYLAKNGFRITEERVVLDAGRCYQLIASVWDGMVREFSHTECLLGALNLERARLGGEVDKQWLTRVRAQAERRIAGMNASLRSLDKTHDLELIETIDRILSREGKV